LDARNLPSFNTQQFEGRIERPISKNAFYALGILCVAACLIFLGKIGQLQIMRGPALAARSVNNTLRHIPVFAERGLITDRNGVELAWNTPTRSYITKSGFGHLLGYVGRPNEKEVSTTEIHPDSLVGRDGAEKHFDRLLQGESGIKIEEVNATGEVLSDYILRPPTTGENLTLSIDSRLQEQFYKAIKEVVDQGIFVAGAAVMMDLKTGELIVMTSAPEYDPNVISTGSDRAAINSYLTNKNQPFLNRVIDGLYTPGSIVKPIMALAALQEGVVTPETKILSTGSISVANPYNPSAPTIFKDWRAQGWVNIREALAVSSDVYFYEVGGGYQNQKGIGIANIDKYAQMFGLGQPTGLDFLTEEAGVIPTPEWKAKVFKNDPWRIGNTYHTAIGQYGYQVTPLQMVRAVSAVATSGKICLV
jgi:penicillin-binding protein 2